MIEETLTALLKGVTPKVFPIIAPENASAPFLVYQRASTVRPMHLDSVGGLAQATFRVDVYHSSVKAAVTLANQIRVALNGYSDDDIEGCTLVQERDLSDISGETALFRVNLEFLVTYSE